jgi:hypothetical protein
MTWLCVRLMRSDRREASGYDDGRMGVSMLLK